ncbi:hypothetical protein MASR1M32_37830 [Rhodobacter sp.]
MKVVACFRVGIAALAGFLLPMTATWALGEGGNVKIVMICNSASGVDRSARDAVCEGFLTQLRGTYPGHQFDIADSATKDGPGLELRITAANRTSTAIQLVWTDAAGNRTTGAVEAVSSPDRAVTQSMQLSLFNRALAATPMPQ